MWPVLFGFAVGVLGARIYAQYVSALKVRGVLSPESWVGFHI
jgi:hypothetical protein